MTALKAPVSSHLDITLSLFYSLKIDHAHILSLTLFCYYGRVGEAVTALISLVRNAVWLSD